MTSGLERECSALLRLATPAVFALVDPDGIVVETDGDWRERGLAGVVRGASIDRELPALVGLLPLRSAATVQLSLIEAPGDTYLDLIVKPADGRALVGLFDVTAKGRALQELQQRRNELMTVNAALLRTLDELNREAAVSRRHHAFLGHEVRSSIQNIAAALELMERRLPGVAGSEYLKSATASTASLMTVITGAIELERPSDAARMTGFRPSELLSAIAAEFKSLALCKGLALVTRVGDGGDCLYSCEVERLRHVLRNLVGNAIKFSDAGDVELSAERASDRGRTSLLFDVADRGPGMDQATLEAMFQPFAPAAAGTSAVGRGFGLGLYICKKLIDALGGRITVRARPGPGSVFQVSVPVA